MDWDSNCYLESYFVVLMIGVVLMMVNICLVFEQIVYMFNYSGVWVLLVNCEFLLMLESIEEQLLDLCMWILLDDGDGLLLMGFVIEYEVGLWEVIVVIVFLDFDENICVIMFYMIGIIGLFKGVYFIYW